MTKSTTPSNDDTRDIRSLPQDIYGLFGSGKEATPSFLDAFLEHIREAVINAISEHEPSEGLRGSRIGESCDRKVWYDARTPHLSEGFDGNTLFKFLSGHVHEALVLYLAKEAGHTVEYEQHTVDVDGVPGHLDAVVDGTLADVKTTTLRGIGKYNSNGLLGDDPFGYLDQIEFYREGLKDDPVITNPHEYAFIAVSRERGDIVVDVYDGDRKSSEQVRKEVQRKQNIVLLDKAPPRNYTSEPDGASGNKKLPMKCVYCNFKRECWKDSNNGNGLRVFDYSGYPRYLTSVVKLPKVPEIT